MSDAEVDMSGHPDAAEIESRLRAVFEQHGRTPPAGTTAWSRLRAAGGVAAATVLTGCAVASSGRRRLAWGLAALTAWLFSGYAVSAVSATGEVTRGVEHHPRAQDLPSR